MPLPIAVLLMILGDPLPGSAPLERQTDWAAAMVESIDAWLMEQIAAAPERRAALWSRGARSDAEFQTFLATQRERLQRCVGLVDPRVEDPAPRPSAPLDQPTNLSPTTDLEIVAVRWEALAGLHGEGLRVRAPGRATKALILIVPDADQSPEAALGLAPGPERENLSARIHALAEAGCEVIVMALLDRRDEFSVVGPRATNQPHREFVYRQAYELGRHPVGYEAQQLLALVDWFGSRSDQPIGVYGHGEGGQVVLVAAACDERIDAVAVAGYFGRRESVWSEPLYRNVWRQLAEFGDAELAALVVPRGLVVETSAPRLVAGPPAPREGREGAAPGAIGAPRDPAGEFARAQRYAAERGASEALQLVAPRAPDEIGAGLTALFAQLVPGRATGDGRATPAGVINSDLRLAIHDRLRRQFREQVGFTQHLLAGAAERRREFWRQADDRSLASWTESTAFYRDYLRREVIGHVDRPLAEPNPRTRLIYDEPAFRGYEVVLDVFDGVFAQGILLVPKDLRPGERRPVVVCQHGLEGRPTDVADPRVDQPAYHRFACQLTERGFVTYAPQNPYLGGDKFRVLQRKANPLGLTLFSFIVPQHEQTVRWLASQPFVDPERIAFYGLSYGGKTAMRVPPLVAGYCLSICSADFNEWIWKNASADSPYSYLATGEYEMPEFDLGNTFNYAELAGLIAPRPFMVERGHDDGVAPDEQVAFEYAKVRRRYAQLGIPERTRIEFFDGPHTIHGVGTFEFLDEQLRDRSGVK